MTDIKEAERAKLTRFYAHYQPTKTAADVDGAINKYGPTEAAPQGNYAQMWSTLESRYGAYSAIPEDGAAAAPASPSEPPASPSVPLATAVEPASPAAQPTAVEQPASPAVAQPTAVEQPASPAVAQPPAVEQPAASPTVPDDVDWHRQRLTAYYAQLAPTKTADDIELALNKFSGRLPEMWNSLQSKYGSVDTVPALAGSGIPPPAPAAADQQQPASPAVEAPAAGPAETAAAPAETAAAPAETAPETAAAPAPAEAAPETAAAPSTAEFDSAGVNLHSIRDRLKRFYNHYCPSKGDSDISAAIDMFRDNQKGGFDAMFAKLETKYGAEKDIPETVSVVLSDDEQKIFDRLTVYYQHYGVPRTAEEIKNSVLKFRNGANGGYDKMWAKLLDKYGPEPGAGATGAGATGAASQQQQQQQPAAPAVDPEAPRDKFETALEDPAAKLRRFYDTHAPTKTDDDIKTSLLKFVGPNATAAGGVQALYNKLAEKYGAMPLPLPGYAQQWARLRKYFDHYGAGAGAGGGATKTKNSEIDWMLAKAYSTPTGVNTLWQNLIAKHGTEPLDPEIEKAMKGPTFLTARSVGEPPSVAMSTMPRADDELFRRPKHKDSGGEVVRVLVNFAGIDNTMLEELSLAKRRNIADALEQQLALNAGMQAKHVSLIDFRGSDAEYELTSAPGAEHQLFHAAASVVNKTTHGGFSVKLLREVLLKEVRHSALLVHAVTAKVIKASQSKTASSRPAVSDPAAVARESANMPAAPTLPMSEAEVRAIRIADEVARMTEQQRMQYSWKKSLEERLSGSRGGGSSLSYKRNNEAYREFMSNIWSETATAFKVDNSSSRPATSQSQPAPQQTPPRHPPGTQ